MTRQSGFTLIELLAALLVLSLLALLSYRGLSTMLDTRAHIAQETDKWRNVSKFFARFEHDVQLAAPRPVRSGGAIAPAWLGQAAATAVDGLEFSRFAATDDTGAAQRVAYRLNEKKEIELLMWSGLDAAPGALPVRYPVLSGVKLLELKYLGPTQVWMDAWPVAGTGQAIPMAVRVRLVLSSDEEIIRIFALQS